MPHRLVSFRMVLAFLAATVFVVALHTSINAGETLNRHPKVPTQSLWVTSQGAFSVLQGKGLTRSGLAKPELVFGNPRDYAGGITFDGKGNVWGSVLGGMSFIFELTPEQLRKLANHKRVRPVIEIGNAGGYAIHFDTAGNLWLCTPPSGEPEIFMYAADRLVNGTSSGPARSITFANNIGNVTDFSFDAAGNLWFDSGYSSNAEMPTALSELTPDQFAASGVSIVPHLEIPGAAGKALTFDASGNLWAATEAGIEMYPPNELTGTGIVSMSPSVVITPVPVGLGASFNDPDGLAFDSEGNLWVASAIDVGGRNFGGIAEIAADQLSSSGSPQPVVVLKANRRETNLGDPSLLTFGPRLTD